MDPDYIHDKYRFGKLKWTGSKYYDYPDGEDLAGKLAFCGQVGFLISTPIGILNAYIKYPYPTSQAGKLLRLVRTVVPGTAMGLAFACATYYAAKFRQKDDFVNHAIGGVAAGVMVGAATGFQHGIMSSIGFALVAGFTKFNSSFRKPAIPRNFPPSLLRNKYFGGFPHPQGNWVKAMPPDN